MKKLYVYYDEQFDEYKNKKEEQGTKIISVSKISKIKEDIRLINGEIEIDLTTLGMALQNRGDLAFNLETVFDEIPDSVKFIVSDEYKEIIKKAFKFDFSEFVSLYNIDKEKKNSKKIMIGDLDNTKIDKLFEELDKNIYGHTKFKKEFKEKIKSYRVLNKLEEQKILSIFIMGESGTGKTEAASSLYKLMGGKNRICKISFANYSSKDSLNSLIGSPRGYIGSENGELVKKIKKTDVGLILIDEFEKADEKVHNFFLELLEKGCFSDSQGNDYNLNGYIIVFTSNMTQESFKQGILPELISRFDCICRFQQLKLDDKIKFLNNYLDELAQKYRKAYRKKIDSKVIEKIKTVIDVSNYTNIRILKKDIACKFIEMIENEN